jgi:hypothetical protein
MKVCFSSLNSLTNSSWLPTEDELQNVEMAEEERRKKNQELRIKKRDYTGYDDDEFKEGNQGMKRSVLAKYDEELEGAKETVSHVVGFIVTLLTILVLFLGIPVRKQHSI